MFGRGNWAVLGLDSESLPQLVSNLNDRFEMLHRSQFAAAAFTRWLERPTSGINPYSSPRLDEKVELAPSDSAALAAYLKALEESSETPKCAPPFVVYEAETYARNADAFRLAENSNIFGFWFCLNEYKDVSDVPSLKEGHAYTNYERPYKFLASGAKKEIDVVTKGSTAPIRKQFPVILDFEAGRAYVENANKNVLTVVLGLFEDLGVQFISVAWDFHSVEWPQQLVGKLYENSKFVDAFRKAAEDAGRFAEEEREVIEDPELRAIVRDYFSMTQLDSERWAGLSSPAQIRLHKTFAPITVPAPVAATALLGVTEDSTVVAASVTLQERVTYFHKKSGEERVFRKDIASFDINDQLNVTEVGAALLKGFDLPSFRKDLLKEIKKTKQVPTIREFWFKWRTEMHLAILNIEEDIREVLELKDRPSGIRPIYSESNNDVIEGE